MRLCSMKNYDKIFGQDEKCPLHISAFTEALTPGEGSVFLNTSAMGIITFLFSCGVSSTVTHFNDCNIT